VTLTVAGPIGSSRWNDDSTPAWATGVGGSSLTSAPSAAKSAEVEPEVAARIVRPL
jgi:hypothetical protein